MRDDPHTQTRTLRHFFLFFLSFLISFFHSFSRYKCLRILLLTPSDRAVFISLFPPSPFFHYLQSVQAKSRVIVAKIHDASKAARTWQSNLLDEDDDDKHHGPRAGAGGTVKKETAAVKMETPVVKSETAAVKKETAATAVMKKETAAVKENAPAANVPEVDPSDSECQIVSQEKSEHASQKTIVLSP